MSDIIYKDNAFIYSKHNNLRLIKSQDYGFTMFKVLTKILGENTFQKRFVRRNIGCNTCHNESI